MKRIIFFDGYCNLCNSTVSSLQSKTAQQELPPQDLGLNTIVLLVGAEKSYRSTAILRILYELGGGYTILAMILSAIPVTVRDWFYNIVAKNRYKIFGKKDACRVPTPEERSYFLD
jgi:predicted DCC family thiol-disulfide oxidoreductase YuxK